MTNRRFIVFAPNGSAFTEAHETSGAALMQAVRKYDSTLNPHKAWQRRVWINMKSLGYTIQETRNSTVKP